MILITCLAALLAATTPQKPQPPAGNNGNSTTNNSTTKRTNNKKKAAEPKAADNKKGPAVVEAEPLVKMSVDAGLEAANAALKAAQDEIARLQAIGSDGKEPAGAMLKAGAEAAVAGAAVLQKEISKERKKPAPDGEKKEQPEKPVSEKKKPEPRKPEQKKDNPVVEKKQEA
ncbi:MAG: hypothetical protein ACO3ND_01235 [Opitutales bacterium]